MPKARAKKVGLKRIDAAIDALVPLGFSREVVCKTIKNLLKVYGEDGWVFIEEACYKTVIEAILEEQVEETRMEEVKANDGTVSEEADNPAVETGETSRQPDTPPVGEVTEQATLNPVMTVNQSCNSTILSRPRRPPCYGWISESDDEEEDPLSEPPNLRKLPPENIENFGSPHREGKRPTRWDVRPTDA
ncbi:uncharacterized protein LOC109719409 isoform X1 [Ananas comosus]|uniref:Uncharacterized protein LOC109719409 isoform X1 n=1 Tax=Ananas comosus TaxID=4615 RepID=A0A6P5FZ55_ANACO|nr:uncharacterized protein LOC109719409 isoform X1 [Ananas comosus]XP_020101660.1 uncharacterized protein LOC109719409 isoform X1 [Ananas comosus]XP_020101661.1 uncharacterized protein LOC109719409 isoform X1 [Ananas comosus]XP_020101662.1 uncharacterized protein LOC109719409 isoform X1 [Ananas comosus]